MCKKLAIILAVALVYVAIINAANIQDEKPGTETGVLELNEDQFNGWVNGKIDPLQVAKIAKNQYSALPVQPVGPVVPPVVNCWALFNQYMAQNMAYFQAWANKYCKNYMGCWCCPKGGLCVAFYVKPTKLCFKWVEPVYQAKLAVFEPYLDANGK